jgi:hypothetical protein
MLEKLQIDDFTNRIGEQFTIALTDGSELHLILSEVSPLTTSPHEQGRQAFSLLLRNDRLDAYLPQQIHRLHHPEMGALDLFLVPLGPRKDGMYYEVLFT